MKTTLSEIRSCGLSEDRWKHLLQHLDPRPAGDEPFPVTRVLGANGMKDTLWLLVQKGEKRLAVRFACDCAERAVMRHWAPRYPHDRRPQEAIEAARRWAENPTDENRDRVAAVSHAALSASAVINTAARSSAYAALHAANSAAFYTASLVAADAAEAAAEAAHAAYAVAYAATEEREWQTNHLRKMLEGE